MIYFLFPFGVLTSPSLLQRYRYWIYLTSWLLPAYLAERNIHIGILSHPNQLLRRIRPLNNLHHNILFFKPYAQVSLSSPQSITQPHLPEPYKVTRFTRLPLASFEVSATACRL